MTLQHPPKHSLGRVIFRFLAGHPLDGRHRTDATFARRATRDLTVRGHASRWHHRPGYHRSGYRLAALITVIGSLYGWFKAREPFIIVACTVMLALTCFGIWRTRVALLMWSHRRNIVRPLYSTLAGITGYAPYDNPELYLKIPRNFREDEKTVVRFNLPTEWEGTTAQQKAVTSLIGRRLDGDWSASWFHHASPPYLTMMHAPSPPGKVLFADFMRYMDASAANVLPLGIGSNNELISIDLDSESPHIALSMGTGGGKSDTLALIITFLVHIGCERIDIIDPKRVSHNWARGLPGVYIHRYVTGQMEAIHNARVRMDSRYDALDTDDTMTFPRNVVIIEEQNSLIEDLIAYWDDYRRELSGEERGKTPRQNPAIADLRYILNKGRQCRINVISVYQRMSAKASGGGDARENYGAKLLARHSPQTWKILVGTTPVPRPSRIPGRAILVLGDEHRAIQRAYAGIAKSDGSADKDGIARLRQYALAGRAESATAEIVMPITEAPIEDLVSLREACASGALSIRYNAARQAKRRDPEFPKGIKRGGVTLYKPSDLTAWQDNRIRANANNR